MTDALQSKRLSSVTEQVVKNVEALALTLLQ